MSGAVGGFAWDERPPRSELDLVQHGVPLSAVRDLLGHSPVGMSLRYALLKWSQDLAPLACVISAIENTWIYRSRTEKFDFLRLRALTGTRQIRSASVSR
jgi:hypothetical protein